jgi:hypothetical protein
LATKDAIQAKFFLYRVPAGTILPHSMHLNRDIEFFKDDPIPPQGHHTVNSLCSFRTGAEWVNGPLRDLNRKGELFGELIYCITMPEERKVVIERDLVALFENRSEYLHFIPAALFLVCMISGN